MCKRFTLVAVLTLAFFAGFALAGSDADKAPVTSDTQETTDVAQPPRDSRPHDFILIRSTVLIEKAEQDGAGGVLVAVTPTTRADEDAAAPGAKLDASNKIIRGIVRNDGPGSVQLRQVGGERTYTLAAGEVAIVAPKLACSAQCRAGYYACCDANVDLTVSCECRTEDPAGECQSGGPGSLKSSCGVTGD